MPTTPAAAWQQLRAGNERFVAEASAHPHQSNAVITQLADGQNPFATILSCSDSRVPSEIVFDQGLGDLFVIRTAGHVIGQSVLGSLEYGLSVLGIPLIVVMGHTGCGAIQATIDAMETGHLPGGFLRDLVERLAPSLMAAQAAGASSPDEVGLTHLSDTVFRLSERSAEIRHAIRDGRMGIVGVRYDLATGTVCRFSALGAVD